MVAHINANCKATDIKIFAHHCLTIGKYNQIMSKLYLGLICAICTPAIGAECPAGFIAVPDKTLLVNEACPNGYVPVGNLPSCPGNTPCLLTCPFGTQLVAGTGETFNINPSPESQPSLHIAQNGTTCFVSLVAGQSPHTINIRYNNQVYHTTN